jgi:hypothetical protein
MMGALSKFGCEVRNLMDLERHPAVQGIREKFPYCIYYAASGHSNCPATFNNIMRDLSDATPVVLLHMGAELHAASTLYPFGV